MEKLYKWRIQRWEDWEDWWNQVGKTDQEGFNRTGRVGSNWADLQSHGVNKRQNLFSFLAAAPPRDTNQLLIWLPLISDYIRLEPTARLTACCRRRRATKEQLWWSFFSCNSVVCVLTERILSPQSEQ